MSTYDADDYLDDLGLDIDTSYGLDDYDVEDFDIDDYLDDYDYDDFDIDDYLPTSTVSSSSYPTSSSYDYDYDDYIGVSGDDGDILTTPVAFLRSLRVGSEERIFSSVAYSALNSESAA